MQYKPLHEAIRPTVIIDSPRLKNKLGVDVVLASETFQYTGSFKFRAAYNVVSKAPQNHIITASSGNFGQAIAYACSLLGKTCTIVMPNNSAAVKVDAVRSYGGEVDLIDTTKKSRVQRVSELAQQRKDAYVVATAYDNDFIIGGNATLGHELAEHKFDYIVAPIGGGGLTSGIIKGLREKGSHTKVVAAEPLMANDAARSFRAGYIIANEQEPQTIADGARTLSIGQRNWEILRNGLADVIEVPEDYIRNAVRMLFSFANLKVEPTGALSLGAISVRPQMFRDSSVCCVISGGNVDAEVYRGILAE